MKNCKIALLLLVLPFALMWQLFTHNEASSRMMIGDALAQGYPSRYLVHEYHNLGREANWNPFQMSGLPLAADVQVAPYYVPNMLLDTLLSGRHLEYRDFEALIVLHYSLAGLFCFLYLRSIRLDCGPALIGALAFQFNGFFVGHRGHFNMFAAAVWTMASLWTLERLFQSTDVRQKLAWSGLSALSLSQIATAGHPQQAFYGALFLTAFALYRNGTLAKVSRLSWFVLAGILALGLSAIALLPALELISVSDRSQPSLAFAQEYSLLPRNLLGLLLPEFGNWSGTEFRIYPGILTLVLASLSLLSPKREHSKFFVAVLCLGTFASLGGFTALHSLLYLLFPGFGSIRVSSRIFFFCNLALAVLAAMGAQRIQTEAGVSESKSWLELSKFWGILGLALGAALISVYGGLLEANVSVPESFYTRGMFEPTLDSTSLAGLTESANALVLALLLLSSSLGLLRWGASLTTKSSVWVGSLAVLMIVDLGTYAIRHDTIAGDPTDLRYQEIGFSARLLTTTWERNEQRELIRQAQKLDSQFRIDNRAVLPANSSQIYGLKFWDGYNILDLRDRVDIKRGTSGIQQSKLYDLFGVGYVLTLPDSEDSQACSQGPFQRLFKNSHGEIWQRNELPSYVSFQQDLREVSAPDAVRHFLSLSDTAVCLSEWPFTDRRTSPQIGTTTQVSPISLSLSSPGPKKKSCIVIGGKEVWMGERGISLVAIEPTNGEVISYQNFDTYLSQFESRRLAGHLSSLPAGIIVALCVSDEGFSQLEEAGRQALRKLGARIGPNLSAGSSYCLVGVVGAPANTALESYQQSGPCHLDLAQPKLADGPPSSQIQFRVLQRHHDEIILWVHNDQPSLLTLKESYYPGWQADVDGQSIKTMKAQGSSLATVLPASPSGGHVVRFRFRSPTLMWGKVMTLVSLVLVVLLMGLAWVRPQVGNLLPSSEGMLSESSPPYALAWFQKLQNMMFTAIGNKETRYEETSHNSAGETS